MSSKLLILRGEANSYGFTVSCVPESVFNFVKSFHSDFLRFDMLRINYHSPELLHLNKNKGVAE